MSTVQNAASGTIAPQVPWHGCAHEGHTVQFYTSREFLLEKVSEFLAGALAKGSAAVVVATSVHRDGLADRLSALGLDVNSPAVKGRYLALDASETLAKISVNGWPDAELFAAVIGDILEHAAACSGKSLPVAVFGEMVALLCAAGNTEAAVQLERFWTELGRTHAFSLRCGYPINSFSRPEDTESFAKICKEHTLVIPSESYSALESDEERLRNITSLQQKAEALETERLARRNAETSLELLQVATRGLRELSLHLLQLQDDERRRVAHDLHEEAGQQLALLGISLAVLESDAAKLSPELAKELSETSKIARQVSGRLRDISYVLHPPLLEEMGLKSALRWYAEEFSLRSNIPVALELPPDLGRLTPALEMTLFRVVQECLPSALSPRSRAATVSLRSLPNHVALTIEHENVESSDAIPGAVSGEPMALRGIKERIEDMGGELATCIRGNCNEIKVVVPSVAFQSSAI